jgi:hypothetical protein
MSNENPNTGDYLKLLTLYFAVGAVGGVAVGSLFENDQEWWVDGLVGGGATVLTIAFVSFLIWMAQNSGGGDKDFY